MRAAQTPLDRAAVDVDVVERPRVASGQQHVAGGARADRVDVDVVPDLRRLGNRIERFRDRDVPERVPLPHDESGLQVDLLDHRVGDDAVRRPAPRGEVHADRVELVDPGGPVGRQADLVQVGVVAVTRAHMADLLVARVGDDVFALAEADFEDVPLPPDQGGLAAQLDDLEVRRRHAARQRFEPDQVAFLVGDHRPRRALALVGGEEQVSGAAPRLAWVVDAHRGGRQRGRRPVVLDLGRVARVERERFLAGGVLVRDREARGDRPGARTAREESADGDLLAFPERLARDEALPRARGVGTQHAAVRATARTLHGHARDGRPRAAEEADLGRGRGIRRSGLRRDRDRVALAVTAAGGGPGTSAEEALPHAIRASPHASAPRAGVEMRSIGFENTVWDTKERSPAPLRA